MFEVQKCIALQWTESVNVCRQEGQFNCIGSIFGDRTFFLTVLVKSFAHLNQDFLLASLEERGKF